MGFVFLPNKSAVHVLLSRFYPDFILIFEKNLDKIWIKFWKSWNKHFFEILYRFHPNFILILSGWNRDKIQIVSLGFKNWPTPWRLQACVTAPTCTKPKKDQLLGKQCKILIFGLSIWIFLSLPLEASLNKPERVFGLQVRCRELDIFNKSF